jgi:hypothetical protein
MAKSRPGGGKPVTLKGGGRAMAGAVRWLEAEST